MHGDILCCLFPHDTQTLSPISLLIVTTNHSLGNNFGEVTCSANYMCTVNPLPCRSLM